MLAPNSLLSAWYSALVWPNSAPAVNSLTLHGWAKGERHGREKWYQIFLMSGCSRALVSFKHFENIPWTVWRVYFFHTGPWLNWTWPIGPLPQLCGETSSGREGSKRVYSLPPHAGDSYPVCIISERPSEHCDVWWCLWTLVEVVHISVVIIYALAKLSRVSVKRRSSLGFTFAWHYAFSLCLLMWYFPTNHCHHESADLSCSKNS